jgi:hypothetical protein
MVRFETLFKAFQRINQIAVSHNRECTTTAAFSEARKLRIVKSGVHQLPQELSLGKGKLVTFIGVNFYDKLSLINAR